VLPAHISQAQQVYLLRISEPQLKLNIGDTRIITLFPVSQTVGLSLRIVRGKVALWLPDSVFPEEPSIDQKHQQKHVMRQKLHTTLATRAFVNHSPPILINQRQQPYI
jgi:hypothetical protein